MIEAQLLPTPFLLNARKHLLSVLRNELLAVIEDANRYEPWKQTLLTSLGGSQMDMLDSPLMPADIAIQIKNYLVDQGAWTEFDYRHWLSANGDEYRTVENLAGTHWVFRWGEMEGRHIHIHPGRYAPDTFRIKANTLLTALVVLAYAGIHQEEPKNLVLINTIRSEQLNLSPIRSLKQAGSLLQMMNRLHQS